MSAIVVSSSPRERPAAAVVADVLVVGGLAIVVAGYFQPWLRSGTRARSSFELLSVADRLGVLGDGPARILPAVWVFVPLLAAAAVAAMLVGRHRLGVGIAAVVGLAAVAVAGGVKTAPLTAERGVPIAICGGACILLGVLTAGLSSIFNRPSPRIGEPT